MSFDCEHAAMLTTMHIFLTQDTRLLYEYLREIAGGRGLDTVEHNLARKIAHDLNLPPLE